MDKFEERYKLGEIHRGRMGKKCGWGDLFRRKTIDEDTVYSYLNSIDDINIFNELLNLILKKCKSINRNDLEREVLIDFTSGDSEDIDEDTERSLLEFGNELHNKYNAGGFKTNNMYTRGSKYVNTIKKFIKKTNDCDKLHKLYKAILLRINEVEKNTYEMKKERYEIEKDLFDDVLNEANDTLDRAWGLIDENDDDYDDNDYDYNYEHSGFFNHNKSKFNTNEQSINDKYRGFNYKKYDKSRGGRNIYRLLMNEQSEYF